MRIVPGMSGLEVPATSAATETSRVQPAKPGAAGQAETATLQSTVLEPAMAALEQMPEIDHEKVAALREALAKGELPFDAGKLAALIERYHGARR